MFEFLVFGGWVFWVLLSIVTLVVIGLVEAERPFWTTIVLAGFVALFYKSFAAYVTTATLVWALPIYFVIGGLWSVWRWRSHVKEYVKENIEEFNHHSNDWVPHQITASYHKSKITNWIAFWPWSASWLIVGDTLTGIFNALSNIYNGITESAVKRARQEARRQ